jgi:hypothetical protein
MFKTIVLATDGSKGAEKAELTAFGSVAVSSA